MSEPVGGEITQLLGKVRDGDVGARDSLWQILSEELRATAENLMRGERAGHTLQPSALINEAFLRLEDGKLIDRAQDRRYLLGAACEAMRRVLVDHAKKRDAAKRGGTHTRLPLDLVCEYVEQEHKCDLVELHQQLECLSLSDQRAGRVVEYRFFGNLSMDEIATELNVSKSTVESDWRFAQAWLRKQLRR